MSNLEQIKTLREKTGCGMVEIKKALEEAAGNEEKALEILRRSGKEKAMKKSDRSTQEGIVVSYVHSNKKVGAIVKLLCETDFVARNEEFQETALDIAMHITATAPEYISPDDVPAEVIEKEKQYWIEDLKKEGKDEKIIPKILEGKEKKFREEMSLLSQPFVKNPEITIQELLEEKIGKIGENIQVGGFHRMVL